MKNILQLSTAADITEISGYFLVSNSITSDPATGLDRIAIVKGLEIYPESQTVNIKTVIYLVDGLGNPLNGYVNSSHKNVFPIEVSVDGNNNSIVNLQTMQVVKGADLNNVNSSNYRTPAQCESYSTLADLPVGTLYLPEFEAYRLIAKTQPIDLFALMENAIVQSTKI